MAERPAITVINLWPHSQSCQRCDAVTNSNRCWPYYEEFLHPDDTNPDRGYVPVCGNCYCWLEDQPSQLWLRSPAPTVPGEP